MLLGGLWHGANWTFLIWGGMHGIYLVVNYFWRGFCQSVGIFQDAGVVLKSIYWSLTLIAVIIAWVFFRANSFTDASKVLFAMVGFGMNVQFESPVINIGRYIFVGALLLGALFVPNTNQILRYNFGTELGIKLICDRFLWRSNIAWAIAVGFIFFTCAFIGLTGREKLEFLYFQF
jgi:D-alanyl-lipoteichoic acid acyltransferase DltB (MBOAT superfamily)